MEIMDARGKSLTIGSMVRYSGTGTSGEISAMKVEDEEGWIKMDDSEIWYNTEYLEVLDKSKINKVKTGKRIDDSTAAALEKSKKLKKEMEEINMSSELCDGGG
jgi:hypothetical protein